MRGTDQIYTAISIGLGLAAVGSCWLVWRTWRDPDNWRLDAQHRKIAFNNRKELVLSMVATVGMIVLFFAWAG